MEERGPGTSFSSSEVAFPAAPKDPSFFQNKISIICWIAWASWWHADFPKSGVGTQDSAFQRASRPRCCRWPTAPTPSLRLEGTHLTEARSFYTRVAFAWLVTWVPTYRGVGTGGEDAECVKARGWTGLFISVSINRSLLLSSPGFRKILFIAFVSKKFILGL